MLNLHILHFVFLIISNMHLEEIVHFGSDIRLDRFLKLHLHINHILSNKYIRKKCILINKVYATNGSQRIKDKDKVTFTDLFLQEIKDIDYQSNNRAGLDKKKKRIPQNIIKKIKASILLENEDIIVINKPNGIATQLGTSLQFSLDNILKEIIQEDLFIVHRLDKDTSGIIIFAKNREIAKQLSKAFEEKRVEKVYMAIVHGVPNPRNGIIDYPIKYSLTNNNEYLYQNSNRNDDSCDKKIKNTVLKQAKTLYKTIETYNNNKYALLELKPKTGRKHQLRIHCSHVLNTPIIGDKKYGYKEYNWNNSNNKNYLKLKSQNHNTINQSPMALCSYQIKLPKEIYKQKITLNKLPEFFFL